MKPLTRKEHRAEARRRGEVDFKDHVITTIVDDLSKRVHVFKCATPNDSNNLKFYVSVLPGAVLLHGDIGDLLIDRPSGGLAWLRGSVGSMEYFLGKSRFAKETEFMPGDAQTLLDDEEWRSAEERAKIREGWDQSGDEGEPGRSWSETVYEVTGDFEFDDCRDYTFETLWCYEALRWFIAKLAEVEGAAV